MTGLLMVSGLLCEICYLAYCDAIPLLTDVRVFAPTWPLLVGGRVAALAALLASGIHGWTWWRTRRIAEGAGLRRIVIGWIAVYAVTFLLQPGIVSSDLHTYVLLGRMEAVYHVSPYEVPPIQFRHDPFQPAATAVGVRYTSRYGPAFQTLAVGLVRLAGPNLTAEFFAFRTAALIAALALIALADRLAKGSVSALVLLGWCPLLWMQGVGDGHNEGLYLALLLLAVWLIEKRRALVAGACVGTAIAMKLTAVAPAAALLWYLLHRDRPAAVKLVSGAVIAVGLWTLPSGLIGWNCLRANAQELGSAFFSLPAFLQLIGLPSWLHLIAVVAFLVIFAPALWQAPDLSHWIRVTAAATLFLFLVVTQSSQEWYYLMPLAFAAAADRPLFPASTLWMSALAPLAVRMGLAMSARDVTLTMWSAVFLIAWLEWRRRP